MTRWAGGWRRAAMVTGAALCCAVLSAAPASADVTVTPDHAVRGDAARLTFRVTDERGAAYTTKIELLLPESTPIAEVWPLTVPDWAPSVVNRKLDRPLNGVHHGQVTEVASQITWYRAASAKPSEAAAELQVSLGPMPETDRLVFTVVQTYSDGTVVKWGEQPASDGAPVANQAAVLTLTAPTAAPGGGNGDGHGGSHGGNTGTTDRPVAEGDDEDGRGGGLGSLAIGLLAGLLVGGGVAVWLLRGRRGPAADGAGEGASGSASEPAAESKPEPVSARRAWRLHE